MVRLPALAAASLAAITAVTASAAAQDASIAPSFGTTLLVSGFADPFVKLIPAGGGINAAQTVPGCVGFIANAPDFRVDFTPEGQGAPLIFSVAATIDTTLVIRGPDGDWSCDDDGGAVSGNPAITFARPVAGRYDVWVGAYAPGRPQASFLTISAHLSR